MGTESFHWTSPNWISMGLVGNCTVGCIDTGFWGINDGIRRFGEDCNDVFFSLLSKLNDCGTPSINSYSSVDGEVICVSSLFDSSGNDVISLGICSDDIVVVDNGTDLLIG
jgi:hypothetical protein